MITSYVDSCRQFDDTMIWWYYNTMRKVYNEISPISLPEKQQCPLGVETMSWQNLINEQQWLNNNSDSEAW